MQPEKPTIANRKRWHLEERLATLRGQITVAIFLAVLIPFMLVGSVVMYATQVNTEHQKANEMTELAQVIAHELADKLQTQEETLKAIADMPPIVPTLKGMGAQGLIKSNLSEIQEKGKYEDLFLADADGQVLFSYSGDSGVKLAPEALAAVARGKVGVAIISEPQGKLSLEHIYPVREKASGPILGYTGYIAAQTALNSWLNYDTLNSRKVQVYLIDDQGCFLSQPQLAQEPLVLKALPANADLRKTLQLNFSAGSYHDFQNVVVAGASQRLDNADWILVMETSYQAAMAPAMTLGLILVGVLVLMIIVAVLGALGIAHKLEAPVRAGIQTIDDAAYQLGLSANDQATGAQQQASSVNEITATVDELAHAAEQIATNAEHTLGHAEQGNEAFQKSLAGMAIVAQRVEATARQILALGEKSQRIGEISHIITEVAERTHLLAINAAIEAAGAGEYGRRFSVVASHVKELADATRQSSKQVQQLIDEMRNATNSAIMVTEQANKQVETTEQITDSAGTAISEIVQQVEAITLATQQQRAASVQVVSAMHEVAKVSHQSAQGSTELVRHAEGLKQTVYTLQGLLGHRGESLSDPAQNG